MMDEFDQYVTLYCLFDTIGSFTEGRGYKAVTNNRGHFIMREDDRSYYPIHEGWHLHGGGDFIVIYASEEEARFSVIKPVQVDPCKN